MSTAANPTPQERREIHFSGRVQGVGFRYTTRNIAVRYPVRGFVKNLPDGRVLLVVEGTQQDVAAFLSSLRAEMQNYIRTEQEVRVSATGEFQGFSIQH